MGVNTVVSVLFIVIATLSLVITLNVYYNYYYGDVDIDPVVAGEINPNRYESKMNRMVTSQGLQCRKILYKDTDMSIIKMYWELIDKYSLFHREGVRKLHNGQSSDVRTLTWYCSDAYLCGGLGYRLLGMTTHLLFAMATNRVLLLKWNKTSVENTYLLPSTIDWRYPKDTLNGSLQDLGSFNAVPLKIFQKKMVKSLTGNTMHIQMLFNQIHSVDKILPQLNRKSLLDVHLSRGNNLRLFHTVSFLNLFRINEKLLLFANKVRNKLNLHGEKYVALHIRTGYFNGTFIESSREKRYATSYKIRKSINCATKKANEHIGPNSTIVVVSDSASVKQSLAKKYARVKVLDNEIVHVDKTKEFGESGMLGTWQDLIIMAEADIVVYDHSSFPLLSLAMCGVPKERIVDFMYCF